MATIERKRVTLHPLKEDGTVDPKICLYPKTFIDGIVDRNGEIVDITTQEELDAVEAGLEAQINTKQDILVSSESIKTINSESILDEGNLELVTRDTDQTITGQKTFTKIKELTISDRADKNIEWHIYDSASNYDGELLLDYQKHSPIFNYKNLIRISPNKIDINNNLYVSNNLYINNKQVPVIDDIVANYVNLNTTQTIAGQKTFTQPINASKVIFDGIGSSYIENTENPSNRLAITHILGPVAINGGIEVLNRAGGYLESHLITFKDQYTSSSLIGAINCNYVFPTANKVNNNTYTIATTEDVEKGNYYRIQLSDLYTPDEIIYYISSEAALKAIKEERRSLYISKELLQYFLPDIYEELENDCDWILTPTSVWHDSNPAHSGYIARYDTNLAIRGLATSDVMFTLSCVSWDDSCIEGKLKIEYRPYAFTSIENFNGTIVNDTGPGCINRFWACDNDPDLLIEGPQAEVYNNGYMDWLDLDTRYLKLADTQTITGAKTITNTLTFKKASTPGNAGGRLIIESPSSTVNTEYDISSIIRHTGEADITLNLPTKATGSYTIATTDDFLATTTSGQEKVTLNGTNLTVVTRDTPQTVTGLKTFAGLNLKTINGSDSVSFRSEDEGGLAITLNNGGNVRIGFADGTGQDAPVVAGTFIATLGLRIGNTTLNEQQLEKLLALLDTLEAEEIVEE